MDSISILCKYFFKEFEQESIRFFRQLENDDEIPYVKIMHTRVDEYPHDTFTPYRAKEFLVKVIYNSSNVTQDKLPSLTKKDIAISMKKILEGYNYAIHGYSTRSDQKFEELCEIALNVIELKWYLNINTPETIFKLNNGELTGSPNNLFWLREPPFVEGGSFYETTYLVFAKHLNRPFKEISEYLDSFILDKNITNQNDITTYSNKEEDPFIPFLNFSKAFRKSRH